MRWYPQYTNTWLLLSFLIFKTPFSPCQTPMPSSALITLAKGFTQYSLIVLALFLMNMSYLLKSSAAFKGWRSLFLGLLELSALCHVCSGCFKRHFWIKAPHSIQLGPHSHFFLTTESLKISGQIFLNLYFFGVQLINNVVLVSGDSYHGFIHVSNLFQILFPFRLLQCQWKLMERGLEVEGSGGRAH